MLDRVTTALFLRLFLPGAVPDTQHTRGSCFTAEMGECWGDFYCWHRWSSVCDHHGCWTPSLPIPNTLFPCWMLSWSLSFLPPSHPTIACLAGAGCGWVGWCHRWHPRRFMFILHVSKALNCVIPHGVWFPGPFLSQRELRMPGDMCLHLHCTSTWAGVGDRESPSLKKKKNSKKNPKPNPPQSSINASEKQL